MTGILEGTLEVSVRSRKLDATKYKNIARKSKLVFSVSFWNPRNPTRQTPVIPLEGYEAPLQVSF